MSTKTKAPRTPTLRKPVDGPGQGKIVSEPPVKPAKSPTIEDGEPVSEVGIRIRPGSVVMAHWPLVKPGERSDGSETAKVLGLNRFGAKVRLVCDDRNNEVVFLPWYAMSADIEDYVVDLQPADGQLGSVPAAQKPATDKTPKAEANGLTDVDPEVGKSAGLARALKLLADHPEAAAQIAFDAENLEAYQNTGLEPALHKMLREALSKISDRESLPIDLLAEGFILLAEPGTARQATRPVEYESAAWLATHKSAADMDKLKGTGQEVSRIAEQIDFALRGIMQVLDSETWPPETQDAHSRIYVGIEIIEQLRDDLENVHRNGVRVFWDDTWIDEAAAVGV